MIAPLRWFYAGSVLLVCGCRPADPLDWKIDAKTPNHYNEWHATHFPQLPRELQQEFAHSFRLISAIEQGATPKNMNASNNPLCQRLHRQTVRSVILDGYHLEAKALLSRVSNVSDTLLHNIELRGKADSPEIDRRFERVQNRQETDLSAMNARLEAIKQRVAILSQPKR